MSGSHGALCAGIRRIKLTLLRLLGAAALAAQLHAADPAPAPAAAAVPAWNLPTLDYFIQKLPPPPRPGSFRDRMDVSDAIARQQAFAAGHEKRIQKTYRFTVFYFSKALGPNFTPANYPKTAAFFTKLIGAGNVVVGGLKNHYQRPRPFQAHPDQIKLLVPNEPGYSYPSGHTTRSRLAAFVMADLAPPAYRKAIFAAAEDVAVDRILAGEHYLTDLEGGRSLGKMLYWLLSKNPQFQTELQAVRAAEWTPPATPLAALKP